LDAFKSLPLKHLVSSNWTDDFYLMKSLLSNYYFSFTFHFVKLKKQPTPFHVEVAEIDKSLDNLHVVQTYPHKKQEKLSFIKYNNAS